MCATVRKELGERENDVSEYAAGESNTSGKDEIE